MSRRRRHHNDNPFLGFDPLAERSVQVSPAAAARLAEQWLDEGRVPEGTTRAALLVQLGDYRSLAGDLPGAEQAMRAAVADGGAHHPDPRLHLASVLYTVGQVAEADELMQTVWAERTRDPMDCQFAAEVLEQRDELAGALRWANRGSAPVMRSDDVPDVEQLLVLITRTRVRLAMGFTPDVFDEYATETAMLGWGTVRDAVTYA